MTFVSYAQNFEDVLLWRALHDIESGRYLDIGAQDPVVDSVSLAFYEAGWRGVHVEATPAYAEKLRLARPDETVIQAAVSDSSGPLEFYEFPDTGLSTGKVDIAERHAAAGFAKRKIVVPALSLKDLLEMENAEFHWLKIDVEGMEADVLRSWGDSDRRPWVLVIEATYPLSQEPSHFAWAEELFRRGYHEVHFDGLSRYFLHESQTHRRNAFEAPANVFDPFVVTRRHFSAGLLRGDLEQLENRIDQQESRATELENELTGARQGLDEARASATAAQNEILQANQRRDEARAELLAATNALVQAEQEYRNHIESLWRDRNEAERQLRQDFGEREDQFRQAHADVAAQAEEARIELARLDERAAQLMERLASSEQERERARNEREQREREFYERLSETRTELDRAYHEAEGQRAIALQADTLIRRAAESRLSRLRLFAEALGLVRPSEEIAALARWTRHRSTPPNPANDQATHHEAVPIMSDFASTTGCNPYLRANSLAELLSWHDLDFIRCAYVTVLGRQPDPGGEAFYTARLRSGVSKTTILRQLRFSPEAKRHDPGIAGFDKALKRHRNANRPLIGPILRAVGGYDSDSSRARRARAIENAVERLGRSLARQQQDATAQALLDIQNRVHWIAGQLAQLTDQVASIKSCIAHLPNGAGEPQSPVDRFDPSGHATDDLDLSSRERSIVWALQSARY